MGGAGDAGGVGGSGPDDMCGGCPEGDFCSQCMNFEDPDVPIYACIAEGTAC
jgi:hypothetical protein